MRGRMRHTAVLVLECVLLAVVMAACGGEAPVPTPVLTSAPTPDVEATAQARLKEERATEATVEARAQTMAKAMVETTAQAVPTATPIPPSSTPTSVPKISTDSSQSFGNSRSVGVAKSDLDSDGGPEQPTSQPSPPIPDKPKHPHLNSRLNKMVRQIGSRSTADIASSAPVSIGDLVGVTVRLSHDSSSTVDFLESVGAIVANIGTDYIEAYTPVAVLVPLSERDGVLKVSTIVPPHPAVTSQGTSVHRSQYERLHR